MTARFQVVFKLLAAGAVITLVAAACSNAKTASPSIPRTSAPAASPSEQHMMMQPGADKMHVTIASPATGLVLTKNSLAIRVAASGFKLSCDYAGKDNRAGFGHYHVLLDKALINMFCTQTATVSMQNVKPGRHTLAVVPTQNDHAEIEKNEAEIHFTYRPANPLPQITPARSSAQPSIKIVAPASGTTLSGPFTVRVQISNFHDSCNLLGKPDVPGYGHWHTNVDSMTGPMMGMMTMLGMSCTDTFKATTSGLTPGSTHTLIALLTDNGHAPLEIFDRVAFKVA